MSEMDDYEDDDWRPQGTIYSNPAAYGLEIFEEGDHKEVGSYQFNKMVVFRDTTTGDLYYAQDSGCSCPTPFESLTSREELTRLTSTGFEAFAQESRDYFDRQEQDTLKMRVRYVRAMEHVRRQPR